MVESISREIVGELVSIAQEAREEDLKSSGLWRLAADFDNFAEQIAPVSAGNWNQATRKEFERLRVMAGYLLYNQPSKQFTREITDGPTNEK